MASENPEDTYLRRERTAYLQSRLNLTEQALLCRVRTGGRTGRSRRRKALR